MLYWDIGGFDVDPLVSIEADKRSMMERLLRYLPPRPLNRLVSVSYGSFADVDQRELWTGSGLGGEGQRAGNQGAWRERQVGPESGHCGQNNVCTLRRAT